MLAGEEDVELIAPEAYDRPGGNPEHIDGAAQILADAQRPAI